jgi:hypothetical protein
MTCTTCHEPADHRDAEGRCGGCQTRRRWVAALYDLIVVSREMDEMFDTLRRELQPQTKL